MSLLETTAALHPTVIAAQRPTLAPDWTPRGRHAAAPGPRTGARTWDDVLRLLDRNPRHRAEPSTFGLGLLTSVRAQQELRSATSR